MILYKQFHTSVALFHKQFHTSVPLLSERPDLLNILQELTPPSEIPHSDPIINTNNLNSLDVPTDGQSEYDPNYDPFENVDKSDPFFGLLPKLLRAIIKNRDIPLEEVLKEHGLSHGIIVLLYNYPISTLLSLHREELQKIDGKSLNELNEEIFGEEGIKKKLESKISFLESKVASLEENQEKFNLLFSELEKIQDRSLSIIKKIDQTDIAIASFQIVSPFLVYRALLITYKKFVLDPSYKPQSLTEQELMVVQKNKLAKKFNRVGLPLLFLSYFAMNEINKNRNAQLIKSIKEGLLGIDDSIHSSSSSSSSSSFFFSFITKSKWLIYLIPVFVYMIVKIIASYYPCLNNIISEYGVKLCISLSLIWVFLLCINYTLELLIYNIYILNNSKIIFPKFIEWIVNHFYKDLWEQSQSSLRYNHKLFYYKNLLFHLLILFILFLIFVYVTI